MTLFWSQPDQESRNSVKLRGGASVGSSGWSPRSLVGTRDPSGTAPLPCSIPSSFCSSFSSHPELCASPRMTLAVFGLCKNCFLFLKFPSTRFLPRSLLIPFYPDPFLSRFLFIFQVSSPVHVPGRPSLSGSGGALLCVPRDLWTPPTTNKSVLRLSVSIWMFASPLG